MTTTTSKLGADMLTDEQIEAFEGLPIEQAKFYFDRRNADGRTHREMVADLLARQPAAIDKDAVDLSAENWAPVFHTAFRHAGDSRFANDAHNAIENMRHEEWLQIVDYMLIGIRRKLAAPLANEASKPAASPRSGVQHFNYLCSLLPEGFHWGDPLTPDVMNHIVSAAAPSVEQDERGGAFERSLASVGAHDPQSFIDGAKWQEARAASTSANVAQGAEAVSTVDFSPENWASVFHTAFRHAGNSRFASDAHNAIELMDSKEWRDIVEYVLIAIKRALTAAQSASGDKS